MATPLSPSEPAHDRLGVSWPGLAIPFGRLRTGLDLLMLAGFWLLFFWPILVRQDRHIPYDILDQHYMFQAFINRSLHTGQGPWWAPHIMSGYPLVADPLSAMFYPPNLVMYLLAGGPDLPYIYLEWQSAVHSLWAALGTYVLARSLTGSRAGAVLAALIYAFGSFFATHASHLSALSALSWLPWILLAYRKACHTRSLGWALIAALMFGVMALAGHAQTAVQIAYVLGGLTLLQGWWKVSQGRQAAGSMVGIGLVVIGLGVGLAMVQLLPSAELSAQTERAGFTYELATLSSLMPQHVLTLLIPNFFAYDGPARFWGFGDPAETNLYVGLLPLFLAALGVLRARMSDRRTVLLLLFGAVLALALAFGSRTWLYRVAFDILPGVDHLRRPVNHIALMQLALALLGAYGVKTLQPDGHHPTASFATLAIWLQRALAASLVTLALAAIALAASVSGPTQHVLTTVVNSLVLLGVTLFVFYVVVQAHLREWISARLCLVALVLIAALDLATAMAGKTFASAAGRPDARIGVDHDDDPERPVVRFLLGEQQRASADRFRIAPELTTAPRTQRMGVWENGPLVWGLESIDGYSVLWPRYYLELSQAADGGNWSLFDLLNVRYLVTGPPLQELRPGARVDRFRLVYDGWPKVYENGSAFPRTWVAHQAVYRPGKTALAYLQANIASLRDLVVLAEPPAVDSQPQPAQPGRAEIVDYQNNRVLIRATLPAPGYVVLADTYYPGWEASVDGQSTHVYRADHAFRAVYVPEGVHEVEFRYEFPTLRLGALISGVALAIIVGLVVFQLGSRFRSPVARLSAVVLVGVLFVGAGFQARSVLGQGFQSLAARPDNGTLYLASYLAERAYSQIQDGPNERQLVRVPVGAEPRLAVFQHSPSQADVSLVVPSGRPWLVFGAGIVDACAGNTDGAGFAVDLLFDGGEAPVRLFERTLDPVRNPQDRVWADTAIDLFAFAGRSAVLRFQTTTGPRGGNSCDWGAWSEPRIQQEELVEREAQRRAAR